MNNDQLTKHKTHFVSPLIRGSLEGVVRAFRHILHFVTKCKHLSVQGFTLLELLLVIAVVAVLAGIILFALNPAQRLEDANSAQTIAKSDDIRKAIEAYVIDHAGSMPTNLASLTTYGIYDICKAGQSTNCLNLDQLVTDGYLGSIPEDKDGSTTVISGYKIEYDPAKSLVNAYSSDSLEEYLENSSTLTKNLLAWWKLDEASWNGTANEVIDSSGNNYHGVRVADANTASGYYGNAGSFDGTDGYVTVSTTKAVSGNNRSVFMWVKHNNSDNIFNASGGWNDRFFGTFIMLIDVNNVYYNLPLTGSADNNWHHVGFTFKDGVIKSYVDGVLISNMTTTGLANLTSYTLSPWFGRLCSGSCLPALYYNGKLDDIRIYERALSSYEVTALYNYAPPAVAHWKFDEGSGTDTADSTINNTSANITNGVNWVNTDQCVYGSCLRFTATNNNNIIVLNNAELNFGTGNFSISSWIRPLDYTYPKTLFPIQKGVQTYLNGNAGWASDGYYSTGIGISYNDGTNLVTSAAAFNSGMQPPNLLNKWSHLTIVINKNTNQIIYYINGIEQQNKVNISAVTGSISNSSYVAFGQSAGWLFDGYLDDWRIYNYALTSTQINKVMNNEI
jgi:prepilin-type N-terminal cleavage/methylation domain-containing protein